MDNDNGILDNANDNDFVNQRLPAVIRSAGPLVAAPVRRRFTLPPQWRLLAVAALAMGVGFETTELLRSQNKLAPILGLLRSGDDAASTASDSAALAPTIPRSTPSSDSPTVATPSFSFTAVTAPSSSSIAIKATTIPSVGTVGDACRASSPAPQVVVSGPPTILPADASASLGVTVDSAPDGAQLVICGFAAKSVFSAGRSIDEKTWVIPVSEAADAALIPPQGFVGPMKLVVALVNKDESLTDRRTVRLQWLPQTPVLAMGRREVNEQLEEGKRLKARGNLTGARVIFLRLAQNGDSRAAFLLAETYDPISLAKHQLPPPDSDLGRARLWYRRASEQGSQEANIRLERLSNW